MKTKSKTNHRSTKSAQGNAAGRELMQGVREALRAATTGDYSTLTIRQIEIADPGAYGINEVKSLRESLGVSQSLFAQLLGVSPRLVAHWEYGIRTPAPVARRLLDRIKQDPAGYMNSIMKRREVSLA